MRRQASGRQATPLKTTAVRLVPPPWEHSSPGTRNITFGQLLHFRVRHRDQPLGPPRRPHQAEGPAVEDTDETDGTVADSPRLGARAGERRPVAQQRPDPGTAIGAATVLARTVRVPGTLATLAVTASVESRSWPWASCSWWRPPTVAPRPSCAPVEGPNRYLCLR